jgi:hypothetical protein
MRGDILHTYKTEIKTLHLNLILLISGADSMKSLWYLQTFLDKPDSYWTNVYVWNKCSVTNLAFVNRV